MPKLITLPDTIVGITGYVWLENVGEEGFTDNQFAGTRGESRRMEGFQLAFPHPPGSLGLRYRVHVQSIGWMDWVDGGTYAGTKDQGLRCECFQIEITGSGPDPFGYLVMYMAHQENHEDDIGPFSEGQACGSVGLGLRLEGMAVTVVNKIGQKTE
ncbi:MAG TPA: hypothetical protein VNY31_07090 [Solirubrobacteraceae bacterium]|nr:hypothetical protein [Solirubrobacteraceae bacterium]